MTLTEQASFCSSLVSKVHSSGRCSSPVLALFVWFWYIKFVFVLILLFSYSSCVVSSPLSSLELLTSVQFRGKYCTFYFTTGISEVDYF